MKYFYYFYRLKILILLNFVYIFDLIKLVKSFSLIFPDFFSSNFPFLNNTNDGNPSISYFSRSCSNSSPSTFKNLTSFNSFETFTNYK